jgi:hypothetical protein
MKWIGLRMERQGIKEGNFYERDSPRGSLCIDVLLPRSDWLLLFICNDELRVILVKPYLKLKLAVSSVMLPKSGPPYYHRISYALGVVQ